MTTQDGSARAYRTIWISDFHLGTKTCRADCLLDFIRRHESEYLYLVGDVVDGWKLKRSWFWDQTHNDVIQKLLRKARKGTKVTYIPGNHDAFARSYAGLSFGGVAVRQQAVHLTADRRRLLVMHGDEFDCCVMHAPWLARLGSVLYEFTIRLNHWFNRIRALAGRPYWSLSAYLKHRVKKALMVMDNFEHALVAEAQRRGACGVVCGHIHRAAIRRVDGIDYYNTGDWVESCTALVEHFDGSMEIVTWSHSPSAAAVAGRELPLPDALPAPAT
jgi:UDP-2,3-diacylglucosamine pyrophosphatase LpxH